MWTMGQMLAKTQTMQNYKLLSDFNADFWTEYKNNSADYDAYFTALYRSFIFYDQTDGESIDDVIERFTKMIKSYLMANSKRLSELWRINVVPDDEGYSITENYYLEETYNGTSGEQSANTSGQRTDINNNQIGEQNIENITKSAPFNNATENLTGSTKGKTGTRNDIAQFTQGKQTNTEQKEITDAHTLVRHGAIGTMTVTDVLKKQDDYWSNTHLFYDFVFNEICQRYLLIGG